MGAIASTEAMAHPSEATSVAMLRSWSHARRHLDAVIELRHYCDFNELATFGDPNCPAQLQRKLRLDG
jgi:hypothetical protein